MGHLMTSSKAETRRTRDYNFSNNPKVNWKTRRESVNLVNPNWRVGLI